MLWMIDGSACIVIGCVSLAFTRISLAVRVRSCSSATSPQGFSKPESISIVSGIQRIGTFSTSIACRYTYKTIPTISLGIPNTESGHCGKTIAGLKYLDQKIENDTSIQWIIVVDDDTILSVSRLSELLSCYDAKDEVAIGERYGYGVLNQLGFNYITGGGGMVFSRALLRKLVKSCKCPAISAPDDMVVGHCLVDLGVSVTHSHLFHQARPMDYSPDLLKSDKHVSFHKHWMVDPIAVYEQWFAEEDSKLAMNYNVKIEL